MTSPEKTHSALPSVPLFPPKSTEYRLRNFDHTAFRTNPSTVIYRLADAMMGSAGAADLKKGSFMVRLEAELEGISFSDLDYIFGGLGFIGRSPYESYNHDPKQAMLTSDEWDEVRVKDAWYRDRIRKFFEACSLGGTTEGLRMTVMAVTSADCDVYEIWRYVDNYGLTQEIKVGAGEFVLGRSPQSNLAEVVLVPHKKEISGGEKRLLIQMLRRLAPADTVVTVNIQGVAMRLPVSVRTAAADGSYFQVEKEVTATPVLSEIPAPELLAIDLLPTEKWMFNDGPNLAPYRAYNISQESSYYYLIGGGTRSPIDSVTYGTLGATAAYSEVYVDTYGAPGQSGEEYDQPNVEPEKNFRIIDDSVEYTDWIAFPKADSPDNYPGGKYGIHPRRKPALNANLTRYNFPYSSQEQYVSRLSEQILGEGGVVARDRYRLPVRIGQTSSATEFVASLAVAFAAPTRDSTITSAGDDGEVSGRKRSALDARIFLREDAS